MFRNSIKDKDRNDQFMTIFRGKNRLSNTYFRKEVQNAAVFVDSRHFFAASANGHYLSVKYVRINFFTF